MQLSGPACCLISALAFTAVNILMRRLTVLQCDPIWAIFGREASSAVIMALWLFNQRPENRPNWPSGRILWRFTWVGVLVQVVGNVGIQWSLGVVGLAVTIPTLFGTMIVGGAVLGHAWLGEQVSHRSAIAVFVLITALVLLGIGAETVGKTPLPQLTTASAPLWLIAGVAAAGLSGTVLALLNIAIRHGVQRNASPAVIALWVPLMAVVSLGPICLWRQGLQVIATVDLEQRLLMLLAGVLNLAGFLALIYGLRRITVIQANSISATQVAMAAAAGMLLFHEPPNFWLLLGILLTIVGIIAVDRPAEASAI